MRRDDLPALAPDAAWRAIHAAACAPYRAVPGFGLSIHAQWAWFWAQGKLARDPVFRGLLERGDLPARARVLDIGGGQGLVAALLHGCAQVSAQQGWPAQWRAAAPSASAYTCIELMTNDARRGATALAGLPFAPRFVNADMCVAPLPDCDLVVILDVLHYVDHAAQDALLRRVRQALSPQGRLLLRVGDAANRQGFAISQWVDRIVTGARGHRVAPTWGRPLEDWIAALRELGFNVHAVPMSQGTPFANVLLVGNLG